LGLPSVRLKYRIAVGDVCLLPPLRYLSLRSDSLDESDCSPLAVSIDGRCSSASSLSMGDLNAVGFAMEA
jgi:hypothetical protein